MFLIPIGLFIWTKNLHVLCLVFAFSFCTPSVFYIGDSIIEQLGPIDGAVNLGKSGIATDEVLSIAEKVPATAKRIYLEGGINDILSGQDGQIHSNYTKILAALPRDAKVFLIGVLPVEESKLRSDWIGFASNQKISTVDAELHQLCKDRCFVIPTPSFSTFDGIHPDEDGKQVLRNVFSQF